MSGSRMDKLYISLREELRVFEEQVQKCRVNFDLQTLQRALALLSEDRKVEVYHWKHIEEYVKTSSTTSVQGKQLHKYLSWLLSYVEDLRTMKDAFDDHVVFPLCDNLYVNDENEATPTPIPLSPPNISGTARQLFHHRRNWALLLSTGSSRHQHYNVTPRSMALLHCIPDIFEESLVTANLAQNWILLHETQSKKPSPTSDSRPAIEYLSEVEKDKKLFGAFTQSPDKEAQSHLKDSREHMMFLLWRAGRAEVLENQLKDAKLKVQTMQQDIDELKQFIRTEGQGMSDVQTSISLENQKRLQKLQRQLDLEKFHHQILSSDWQLELEVRPSLIRQINAVHERCAELEGSVNTRNEFRKEPTQESVGTLSDVEWDTNSIISQSSAYSSDVFSTH
ncbi:uncharacterized protein [Pyxicephalus adspersus]|uniref:uncharacterized protein n=1 Tax=Pyxicephalus adspersus TaxID=30357 RepID=UPI003B5BC94A